ncbi:MAG: ferritin-like domain-containing protein [Ginsengibacter sp.]
MATLINLNDLLRHEILDLYSAEEQIIDALPKMIEKANNGNLKKALNDHLKVTELQKKRLDQVKQMMGEQAEENSTENNGFFSRLFGGGGQKCKGTEGLIEEGKKMMGEDMSPEALDAAIIASAQKIEHYEICGYGTARAYARELNLVEVANLLTQTLNEEYQADDSLTQLAVGRLNIEAQYASGMGNGSSLVSKRGKSSNGSTVKRSASKVSAPSRKSKTAAPGAANKKSALKSSKGITSSKKTTGNSRSSSKKVAKKAAPAKSAKKSNKRPAVRSVAVKIAAKNSGRISNSKKLTSSSRKSATSKKSKPKGRR